jgi:replicative DNA helicase
MTEEKQTFSRFGNDFQEKLSLLTINDREFADQFVEVLDYNFFETKYLQICVKAVYDYRDKYKMHPTVDALEIMLGELARANDTHKSFEQAVEFIRKSKGEIVKDEKFIKDTAMEFCKKQVLKAALAKSLTLLQTSKFDDIKVIIDEACKLGLSKDFGHDYIKDFELRFANSSRTVIPTPWDEINAHTVGGFGRGDLHIIIAPTGIGKSHVMVQFGAYAISQGFKGIHYTLELSAPATGNRYDSCLSGIDINLRREAKDEIRRTISELKGNLIIREWPPRSASVMTIRNHLDKMIMNDFVPDFIIVDYADLLKSLNKGAEKRVQLEEINEELRAIAKEYNVVLLTCSQSNRNSLAAEYITLDSIAEAYSKCMPADFIMTLSRSQKEKDQGLGKFFLAKNRNGQDGIIYKVRVDTSTSTIQILAPFDPDDPGNQPQKPSLLQKFQNKHH